MSRAGWLSSRYYMNRASPEPPFYIEIESSAHEQRVTRCPVSRLVNLLAELPGKRDYMENFQPGSRHHDTGISAYLAGSVVM